MTADSNVVGVYLDCGPAHQIFAFPYVGSSHATTWHSVAGYLQKLRGVAWRVLGQHEVAWYRSSEPSVHYAKGYQVRLTE